jgi:uncharacterized membrane protein YidH (DUF202 family)
MSKNLRYIILVSFFLPLFAHAVGMNGLDSVFDYFIDIFTTLVPLIMGIAVLVFLWGLVKFIARADDERERESGKQLIIWGMIALFVMVSLWSIVGFVQESLLPGSGASLGDLPIQPDTVPTP